MIACSLPCKRTVGPVGEWTATSDCTPCSDQSGIKIKTYEKDITHAIIARRISSLVMVTVCVSDSWLVTKWFVTSDHSFLGVKTLSAVYK